VLLSATRLFRGAVFSQLLIQTLTVKRIGKTLSHVVQTGFPDLLWLKSLLRKYPPIPS
jgi:hypothetical protein